MRAVATLLAVLAVTIVAAALAPATAAAQIAPLLAEEDAVDLANGLADAQDAQDVCYGWEVRINGITTDLGSSNGGPGERRTEQGCDKGSAQLEVDLSYTCDACEGEDSATVGIASSFEDPPTVEDLERLGFSANDLLGDNDDVALVGMVGALPLLVAEHGNAEYVEYELARDIPAADRPTGSPGSDFLREAWPLLALSIFVLLLGPLYWVWKRHTV